MKADIAIGGGTLAFVAKEIIHGHLHHLPLAIPGLALVANRVRHFVHCCRCQHQEGEE